MQKQFNAVLNGKGGVGKSFFAVNFVQYLKDKNILHTACDCDNENSTLKRFHGEAVEFLDLTESRALDAMFRAFEKTDLVVVDCPVATVRRAASNNCNNISSTRGCAFSTSSNSSEPSAARSRMAPKYPGSPSFAPSNRPSDSCV